MPRAKFPRWTLGPTDAMRTRRGRPRHLHKAGGADDEGVLDDATFPERILLCWIAEAAEPQGEVSMPCSRCWLFSQGLLRRVHTKAITWSVLPRPLCQ